MDVITSGLTVLQSRDLALLTDPTDIDDIPEGKGKTDETDDSEEEDEDNGSDDEDWMF